MVGRMAQTITIEEINEAWNAYGRAQCMEVIRKGEKVYEDLEGWLSNGAARAQVVPMRKAMTFPEFLVKKWIR